MARGELIGMCDCPECGFADAEVRPDKSGAPYRFCPDCTSQYFTRGVPHKVKNLLAKVRKSEPLPAPAIPEKPAQEAKPEIPPAPAKVKAKGKSFDMADL